MNQYLRQLSLKVGGVFIGALLAVVAAAQPFNALTFDWRTALTIAGSAAVLALLEGLAGRLTGDKDQASVTR